MSKKNKKGIELFLSPEAIAQLETRSKAGGHKSRSAYVEAWATGELDKEVGEAISTIQTSLKELAKSAGCQHPNPDFNKEFGFYQCPLCGEVWAYADDDPDNHEVM